MPSTWFKMGNLRICQSRPSRPVGATGRAPGRAEAEPPGDPEDGPMMPRRSEPLSWEADANDACGIGAGRAVAGDHAPTASLSGRLLFTLLGGSPGWTPPVRLCHSVACLSVQHGTVDTAPARSQSHALPHPAVRSLASC